MTFWRLSTRKVRNGAPVSTFQRRMIPLIVSTDARIESELTNTKELRPSCPEEVTSHRSVVFRKFQSFGHEVGQLQHLEERAQRSGLTRMIRSNEAVAHEAVASREPSLLRPDPNSQWDEPNKVSLDLTSSLRESEKCPQISKPFPNNVEPNNVQRFSRCLQVANNYITIKLVFYANEMLTVWGGLVVAEEIAGGHDDWGGSGSKIGRKEAWLTKRRHR